MPLRRRFAVRQKMAGIDPALPGRITENDAQRAACNTVFENAGHIQIECQGSAGFRNSGRI